MPARRTVKHSEPASASPLRKPSRNTRLAVRLQLVAAAAGRCEFRGCSAYLFEHPITLASGNFAEEAHIWAFSIDGPRGREPARPSDINEIGNLILLCPSCHKEIDAPNSGYSVAVLMTFKREHEARVRFLAGLTDSARTAPVVLTAKIDGKVVHAPLHKIIRAVAPMWPRKDAPAPIDLTAIDSESEEFFQLARNEIRSRLRPFMSKDLGGSMPEHFSVFAIGPIPALIDLGTALSNALHVSIYQRHKDGDGSWTWRKTRKRVGFQARRLRQGSDPSKVAVSLAVSGDPFKKGLPTAIDNAYSVYEIRPVRVGPAFNLLRTRDDLERFRSVYRDLVTAIAHDHAEAHEVHLFPAVPPAVAVACGYDLNPKLHPTLIVYDFHRAGGGYSLKTRINARHD